jgi:hypothetical protein
VPSWPKIGRVLGPTFCTPPPRRYHFGSAPASPPPRRWGHSFERIVGSGRPIHRAKRVRTRVGRCIGS